MGHPEFHAGNVHTGFIEDHIDSLLSNTNYDASEQQNMLACAATALLLKAHGQQAAKASPTDVSSPWGVSNSWRMNYAPQSQMEVLLDEPHKMNVTHCGNQSFVVEVNGEKVNTKGSVT